MSVSVRDFRDGDVGGLHRDGDQLADMRSVVMRHGSFTKTIEGDGEVLAVLGLVVRWDGVADVWAVIGDGARGRGVALTRAARRLLRRFASELRLRRVGASVQASRDEYCRWIELLGFECEGVEARAAPDGGDVFRYRWFPDG